jgi:hypothetical protein
MYNDAGGAGAGVKRPSPHPVQEWTSDNASSHSKWIDFAKENIKRFLLVRKSQKSYWDRKRLFCILGLFMFLSV